ARRVVLARVENASDLLVEEPRAVGLLRVQRDGGERQHGDSDPAACHSVRKLILSGDPERVALHLSAESLLDVHLIDGTYELFRHFYAVPRARDERGREVGAVRGVLTSVLAMINGGATHIGVATDHVIESFRNRLWPGYKTGDGVDPNLLSQFPLLEEALTALGVAVWPMIEYEADDAL